MVTLKMRRFFLFGVLVLSCVAILCRVCAAKLVAINPGTHDGTTEAVAEFTKKTGIEVEVIATNWTAFDEKSALDAGGRATVGSHSL